MRFRLLRRRLTISAPRMAVRSALPWPFRWVMLAIVLGFCAAIALWAFELGRDIAGLDGGSRQELTRMQAQMLTLREAMEKMSGERDKAQSIADTATTLLTAEKAAQAALLAQNRQLEAELQTLRDDLGFFERLIPATGGEGLSIRGMQAELSGGNQIRWRAMVMQPQKNVQEFSGRLEVSFSGQLNGKPWSAVMPDGSLAIKFRQYGRMNGVLDVPANVVLKTMSVKVLEGAKVRASQSIAL